MKALITVLILVIVLPIILLTQALAPNVDLLEVGDVANILIPLATLPMMAGPVWRSLIGERCDNYDRFVAAVFFINLGIEVQMIWRLWDRIAGTSTDFREGVIAYSLAMFALGGMLQIMAFDGDRQISAKVTSAKISIIVILTAAASGFSIWLTHLLAKH